MKNKFLICLLLVVGLASATVRTWNGTDFGGTIATTDTLMWNSTSVENWTASSNLEFAHGIVEASYSGAWSDVGYTMTIGNGGLIIDGTGNRTLGTALAFNGNGSFHMGSTVGTITATNCVVTFNGSYDTTDIDKGITIKRLIVNNNLYNMGSATTIIQAGAATPITMASGSSLTGVGAITLYCNVSALVIDKQESSTFNPSGNFFISPFHSAGSITLTIPEINAPLSTINTGLLSTGTCIFEITGNITAMVLRSISGGSTINTNNHTIKTSSITLGSNRAGAKSYFNVGSSRIVANVLTTSQYVTDSTIITSNGAVFSLNSEWAHGTYERIDGTYTIAPVKHLWMGHSMLAASGGYSPAWFYEENYGLSDFKNRAIGGTVITNTESRVDSCLTAYNPSRFYLWIGQNELNITDQAAFDIAVAAYWPYWTSIIAKVKAANIDSIYIIEMSPMGTVAVPMPATKIANYKRFNAALKDSCRTNNLFWIPTFDSLLEPGTDDVLRLSTTTDGLHPNGTLAGAQYCSYLFSLADKVASPLPILTATTDSLILKVSATGATGYQWRKNKVNISGATTARFVVAANATGYTGKDKYECAVSNESGTVYQMWVIGFFGGNRRINNLSTGLIIQ